MGFKFHGRLQSYRHFRERRAPQVASMPPTEETPTRNCMCAPSNVNVIEDSIASKTSDRDMGRYDRVYRPVLKEIEPVQPTQCLQVTRKTTGS